MHARAEAGEALTPELLSAIFKGLNDKYYGAGGHGGRPDRASSGRASRTSTRASTSTSTPPASPPRRRWPARFSARASPPCERYLRFLSSGSSDYSINLLRDAGVDLSTPQPIQAALDTFGRYLDQLEALL